jgi:hypothetical protein
MSVAGADNSRMATESRETCSVNFCPAPAVHTEYGEVGHWFVTIFYCDEHANTLKEGTPLGPVGIDVSKLRVEPLGTDVPPSPQSRTPGID